MLTTFGRALKKFRPTNRTVAKKTQKPAEKINPDPKRPCNPMPFNPFQSPPSTNRRTPPWVQGLGFLGSGCWVLPGEAKLVGLWLRVWGLGFGVSGLGLTASSLGFGVLGCWRFWVRAWGFRVFSWGSGLRFVGFGGQVCIQRARGGCAALGRTPICHFLVGHFSQKVAATKPAPPDPQARSKEHKWSWVWGPHYTGLV